MSLKPTLGFRISTSLGNRGLSRKGYKMLCLPMPLFLFVSSTNKIKRIRDKIFFFNVRLNPNPQTRQTTRMHGAGCNSVEFCGICKYKVPPLLLEKWAMTGLLFQNFFCQLQAKGEWLTILVTKKEKQIRLTASTINQKNKVLL